MRVVLQLRNRLRLLMEVSFQSELLAACAPRHAAPASALDAFEGLFAASVVSTAFWLAVIALLRS